MDQSVSQCDFYFANLQLNGSVSQCDFHLHPCSWTDQSHSVTFICRLAAKQISLTVWLSFADLQLNVPVSQCDFLFADLQLNGPVSQFDFLFADLQLNRSVSQCEFPLQTCSSLSEKSCTVKPQMKDHLMRDHPSFKTSFPEIFLYMFPWK